MVARHGSRVRAGAPRVGVTTLPELAGGGSGVVDLASFVPYVAAVRHGAARPDRAAWLIWATEYGVLFGAQLARGARDSLPIVTGETIGCLVIAALSVRHGTGGMTRSNAVVLAGVAAALAAWFLVTATAAIILAVGVDMSAGVLTVAKTLRQGQEPVLSWAMYGAAGILALGSVGHGPAILFVYPAAATVLGAAVCASCAVAARRHAPGAAAWSPHRYQGRHRRQGPARL
jgi:hypothetical protein